MKFQLASDLHLDEMPCYNSETIIQPSADILVLAGDLCHSETLSKHIKFFEFLNNNFKTIIYVSGNHEYYPKDRNSSSTSIELVEQRIKTFLEKYTHFIYLNNEAILLEKKFLFVGSTLWFNAIKLSTWFRLNVDSQTIARIYNDSFDFLQSCTTNTTTTGIQTIFITHYPYMYCPESSKPPRQLTILPDIWISGHTHRNCTETKGETVFITNQYKNCRDYSNSFIGSMD